MLYNYRPVSPQDYERVRQFLSESGWAHRIADPELFAVMMQNTDRTVAAWDGDSIVGFGRALCDGVSNGYLSMIAVAADKRGQGIGRELVQRLVGDDAGISWILRAGRGSEEFWSKMGFAVSETAMEKARQPKPVIPTEIEQAGEPENTSHKFYTQAREAMDAGHLDVAVKLFHQDADVSQHFKSLELLGECLIALGRLQEAIVPLAAATTLNNGVRAPALLAEVFWKLHQRLNAENMAVIALARDPNNKKARIVKEMLENDTDT